MLKISIGGDPEFWIKDQSGMPVGAFEFFPGTKENPYPLLGGAVQVDGFAVEVNIDPAETDGDWKENIERVMEQCYKFIPSTHSFAFDPYMDFDDGYFHQAPTIAKVIGCSPSVDYYTGSTLAPPPVMNSTRRYAGGHIHVGFGDRKFDPENEIDRCMLMGICSAQTHWFEPNFDDPNARMFAPQKAVTRLQDYNAQRSVRFKAYGVEYRRPWSWWIDPVNDSPRSNLFNKMQEKLSGYAA